MDITNQIFTPRVHAMDPEFEDVVFGTDLQNGMIVLLQDSLMKGDPEYIANDYDKERLMKCNRWCEVTQFRIINRNDDAPLIKFMGVYSDGTKYPRTYDSNYTWVIKKPADTTDLS